MRRSKGLETMQRLAEYGADAASRDVGQRLRALRAEEDRLRQINEFLGHYDRLTTSADGSISVGALTSRRQFAARQRDATDRQREAVRDHERHYQAQVQRWSEARAQALALQRFNERVRAAAAERRERREQARLDEIGLRRR